MERLDLDIVLTIRRHGSLVKTAQALRLTPAGVTKRLAALEKHLGVRLFQRTTRRVSPTTEGHALCDQAEQLLQGFAAIEDGLRERQHTPAGPIRLVSSLGFGRRWLGPALADFQTRHPEVQIELQLNEQLPHLARESFDAAIWLWQPPAHMAADWVARKLAPNRRVLVAAPSYLQAHGVPRSLDDLGQHRCLVVRENGGDAGQGQRFEQWWLQRPGQARAQPVTVGGPLSSNSGELVRDWCVAGHGIMLRSLWDVGALLATGELVQVLPDHAMHEADIHWLAPYRAQMPLRIRLLQEFLAARFATEPWKPAPARAAPARAATSTTTARQRSPAARVNAQAQPPAARRG